MVNLLTAATIGLLWLGAAAVQFIKSDRSVHVAASGFAIGAGILSLALLPFVTPDTQTWFHLGEAFGALTFVPDGLGVSLAVLAAVVGSLTVLFSSGYMSGDPQIRRYYGLVLLFIGAMIGLVLTSSLLVLFFFWELTALCSYALISYYSDDPAAVKGGIRALVMTQVGGVGLMLAAMMTYAHTGTFQIEALLGDGAALPAWALALVAFGMLAAAAAKSAQVPFHTWLPGAMEAPTPVSALIHAATMVNAGVYLLVRFFPAFEAVPGWATAVMVVGLLSALVGGLMAIAATDLKRVLACSTVSQLGYMVYAIGVGGLAASHFHLINHAIFKALLFLGAGAVIHAVGTRDMRQMGGVGRQMPFTRVVFVVGALGLVGLPVFNGFWSKELILESGLYYGPLWAYGVMLAVAGLTALYTARMLGLVFFSDGEAHAHPAGTTMRLSMGVLGVGVMVSWLLAPALTGTLEATLPSHDIHVLTLHALFAEIFGAQATYLALGVIFLGGALWVFRAPLAGLSGGAAAVLVPTAETDFGFEPLNRGVTQATHGLAARFARLHTGLLNWNVAAIALALLIVCLVLLLGGVL